ncbi:MAG TPA: hypothetical protein VHO47_05120 [Candidatus Babeliales bacterium]|nr:hypothetical protein [Candidatus Babeliales bacterium]
MSIALSQSSSFSFRELLGMNLIILFLCALALRALFFYSYGQHEQRHWQADSMDYHVCAVGIAHGTGMHRVDDNKPIFWRTPGYPYFISLFYKWYGLFSPAFEANMPAQKAVILAQVAFSSLTPLLIFFLAFLITGSLSLAQIAGWIFAFHPGFIVAPSYLLTEAIALLFFFGFLLCLFSIALPSSKHAQESWVLSRIFFGGILLGLYTWMRPNGEFISVLACVILLLSAVSWPRKIMRIVLFLCVFFASLSPWYVRNHNLTGRWFFCPMSGAYLCAFSVPKLIRRAANQPLDLCLKYMFVQAQNETASQEEIYRAIKSPYVVTRELFCMQLALPWIQQFPKYFVLDWMTEVLKTTFDLYSSQLVSLAKNTFKWDQIEEVLSKKVAACLYAESIPWWMRIIAWIEFFYSILLWIGFFAGCWLFLVRNAYGFLKKRAYDNQMLMLWVFSGILIGGLLFMTGGFGYARLRMPAEPLLVILSLIFWFWVFARDK